MNWIKCNAEAREKCPFDHPCDREEKAYFEEGSPCDAFNKKLVPPPPQTNAEHIRSMTDEELAEFLCDATYKENEQGYPIMRTVNKVWWRKWLKQPYREETDKNG